MLVLQALDLEDVKRRWLVGRRWRVEVHGDKEVMADRSGKASSEMVVAGCDWSHLLAQNPCIFSDHINKSLRRRHLQSEREH
ncbi:hypothetical protein BUE80_DR007602 [Diplocarpon rosae]|nr:hypothetical protein BUE80_DR007602 [Diplocarpon rosae]